MSTIPPSVFQIGQQVISVAPFPRCDAGTVFGVRYQRLCEQHTYEVLFEDGTEISGVTAEGLRKP